MPSSPDPSRSERLADIYARAERLRRQRRARLGTGAVFASLAVFLIGLLVGSNLDVSQQLETIGGPDGPPTTTTTEHRPTTTLAGPVTRPDPGDQAWSTPPGGQDTGPVSPPLLRPTHPPYTSSPPTTVAELTPDTTAVPACRNSRDPACGALVYDPPPINRPMSVEVTFTPRNPEPGETVTFTVRVRDDGPVSPASCVNRQSYGEADEVVTYCTAACAPESLRYGPWDTPPPENTTFEETFAHSYAEAGTYTATFSYNLGEDCSFSPYRSSGEASVTVPVG